MTSQMPRHRLTAARGPIAIIREALRFAARAARPRLRQAPRPVPGAICPAERLRAARIGCWLFRHRGGLPVAACTRRALSAGVNDHRDVGYWTRGARNRRMLRLAGVAAAGAGTRRRSRTVAHLVTDRSAFAWRMRNPLYFLGNGLAWAGVAIITGIGWLVPAGVPRVCHQYSLIVRYEEGVLESLFGETYLAYKRHTVASKRPQPGSASARPRVRLARGVAVGIQHVREFGARNAGAGDQGGADPLVLSPRRR